MATDYNTYHGSQDYDSELSALPHFQLYPEMQPWIGRHYSRQKNKLLIIGESHYFATGYNKHHDSEAWYSRTHGDSLENRFGHRIRHLISRGVENNFKNNTHVMYSNINKALKETEKFKEKNLPFDCISYINYFQRPAQTTGKSIKPNEQDLRVSLDTLKGIIEIIKPNLVLFASVKAHKAAKTSNLPHLINRDIHWTAHPTSAHWNKACKKYGKVLKTNYGTINGKERFVRIINDLSKTHSSSN